MKTKTENLLPKTLSGTVHLQYVRCGKQNCHCADGGDLHGPYYYHFYREGGKLKKRYLKEHEVDQVSDACFARRLDEFLERKNAISIEDYLRKTREKLREIEQLFNNRSLSD